MCCFVIVWVAICILLFVSVFVVVCVAICGICFILWLLFVAVDCSVFSKDGRGAQVGPSGRHTAPEAVAFLAFAHELSLRPD